MSLREYTKWWKQHKAGLDDRLLYLKDWHFVNEFPDYQVCATQQWGAAVCMPVLDNSGSSASRENDGAVLPLGNRVCRIRQMVCQDLCLVCQSCQEYLPGN